MRAALLLRSFLRGWWWALSAVAAFVATLVVIPRWDGTPALAGNGTSVWVLAICGWLVGAGATALASWPNRNLTPSYVNSLFTMVTAFLCIVAVGCATLSMLAGNPTPAVGPALLAGSTFTYAFLLGVGRPPIAVVGLVVLACSTFILFATFFGLHDSFFRLLSEPWVQVLTLVLSGFVLGLIKRSLNSPHFRPAPVSEPFAVRSLQQPRGSLVPYASYGRPVVKELAYSTILVGVALVLLNVDLGFIETLMFVIACVSVAAPRTLFLCDNLHRVVHLYWLVGAAESRSDLGRWCANMVLLRTLGWLPAGLVSACVLAPGSKPSALANMLLLVQAAIFLQVLVMFARIRLVPVGSARYVLSMALPVFLVVWSALMTLFIEWPVPVTAGLVLGVVGTGVLTAVCIRRTVAVAGIVV
ncbi:MAG: hypothetical protein F4029_12335 [Gammaproteobacteria bacterium]|nr:hypothetical protein [Gammaproteobacteria bacterium]MXY58910.1 hypothetical protein [Gammaproteobacteria bacterium]MYK47003.1 hypothetical protein [Gammaproteobacteria bacterium]